MMRTTAAAICTLCATTAAAQPRFYTELSVNAANCNQTIPGPIINDSTSPSQANLVESCTQFWAP